MGSALKFRTTDVPRQATEQGRLKIVRGPDQGHTFVITGVRAVLGRGEECDVILSDLRASRKHAEVFRSPQGWQVRDLGSANGIQQGGKAGKGGPLRAGDGFGIGETWIEFFPSDAPTSMLRAPGTPAMQLEAQERALGLQAQQVRSYGVMGRGVGSVSSAASSSGASGLFKNPLLLVVLAGAGLFLVFGDSGSVKKKRGPKPDPLVADGRSLASYLPEAGEPKNKTAETFFREGFREYRENNFLRARGLFETVLQISPTHPLATLYLSNCDKAIRDEVTFHLDRGKKVFSGGKLKEAKAHYEAVQRLLFRDKKNPSYVEASDQIAKINQELSGGAGGGS